jgi:hypothetical protein
VTVELPFWRLLAFFESNLVRNFAQISVLRFLVVLVLGAAEVGLYVIQLDLCEHAGVDSRGYLRRCDPW